MVISWLDWDCSYLVFGFSYCIEKNNLNLLAQETQFRIDPLILETNKPITTQLLSRASSIFRATLPMIAVRIHQ